MKTKDLTGYRVVAVHAHPDDESIWTGGALARFARQGAQVTVLCEEPRPAYDRVHLSSHFDDPRPDLSLATAGGYREAGVAVVQGRADAVNLNEKTVQVAGQTWTEWPTDPTFLPVGPDEALIGTEGGVERLKP